VYGIKLANQSLREPILKRYLPDDIEAYLDHLHVQDSHRGSILTDIEPIVVRKAVCIARNLSHVLRGKTLASIQTT
jgi:hypothetical protein